MSLPRACVAGSTPLGSGGRVCRQGDISGCFWSGTSMWRRTSGCSPGLERIAADGLLVGKTMGIDAMTLEANAAMRSMGRRDTGEDYQEFLVGLANASGIRTPTRAS